MFEHNSKRAIRACRSLIPALFVAGACASAVADTSFAPFHELGGLPGTPAQGLAVDPSDGRIVYADGGGGRISRSLSGGEQWQSAQVGGVDEVFRAITVDPANPAIVLAFSTSDVDGGASGGVYLSHDRGGHWQRLPHQPNGALATAGFGRGILVDARGRTLLLADKLQGVFRSDDFGATWSNPLPGPAARTYTLARDPNDDHSYWAGGFDAAGNAAVWVSRDVGKTWTEVVLPADPALQGPIVTALAVQPRGGRIVAGTNGGTAETAEFSLGGDIYVSDDGGGHWTQASITADHWATGTAIVFDPSNPDLAYAAGNGVVGLLRSQDGGMTWTQRLLADGTSFFTLALSAPAAGRGARLFGAGGGAIEVSDDDGTNWARAERGLELLGANQVLEDGRAPGGLYAQDGFGGLAHSDDGGAGWSRIEPVPGANTTLDLAVDRSAAERPAYALSYLSHTYSLYRSVDVGRHWALLDVALPTLWQHQLLADPRRPGTVYLFLATASSFNTLLRSTDFGATWQTTTIGVDGDYAATPAPLAPDPDHPGVLFAAMGSGLWKSADFGASWTFLPQLPLGLYGIAGLAVTGGAPGSVLVSAGDDNGNFSLQQSRDGGTTWSTGASPFGAAPALLSAGGEIAYAYQWLYVSCSDPSVLESRDGGASWSLADASIENQFDPGECLGVSPVRGHLYLADAFGSYRSFGASVGAGPSGGRWPMGPGARAGVDRWAAVAAARRASGQAGRHRTAVREP